MQSSLLQRLKSIYSAESWSEGMVTWLRNLPFPFWLIGIMAFIVPSGAFIYRNPMQISWEPSLDSQELMSLCIILGLFFTTAFGLFLFWRLEENTKTLLGSSPIIKGWAHSAKNESAPSQPVTKLFYLLRLIVVILSLVIFYVEALTTQPKSLFEFLLDLVSISAVFLSFFVILLLGLKTIKILTAINQLKLQDIPINLFDLSPYYQLSQFTQKIALNLLPLAVPFLLYNYVRYKSTNPGEPYFSFSGIVGKDATLATMISIGPILIILAIVAFIAPIFWIRGKIISTKTNLKAELGSNLHQVLESQDQAAKGGDFSRVNNLKSYADILMARKEYVDKISNWPWETRVFQEFSAAILIPVGLSIINILIDRFAGK